MSTLTQKSAVKKSPNSSTCQDASLTQSFKKKKSVQGHVKQPSQKFSFDQKPKNLSQYKQFLQMNNYKPKKTQNPYPTGCKSPHP
jgi:hypothetical protein